MKKLIINRPIIIGSQLTLCRPTVHEVEKLKEHLTFDNPAYHSARKFSRYNTVRIPPYLSYYKKDKKTGNFEVPLGTDLQTYYDLSHIKVIDTRVQGDCVKVNVPKFKLELREDQKEALKAYISYNTHPLHNNGLIQLPTGKGKSILALAIAVELGVKTLVVVHKDDLVIGWKKDIDLAFGGKVSAGLIKAKSRELGKFITIATVQTLNRLNEREIDLLYETFGFVIQDEAHHCPATSFSIVQNFRARYKLALTATPERSDGLTHVLHLFFGGFAYQYKATAEEKDILPVRVFRKDSGLYFNPIFCPIKTKSGVVFQLVDLYATREQKLSKDQIRLSDIPYNVRPKVSFNEIEDWVVRQSIYQAMIIEDILQEFYQNHSCVVFFTQKEHCNIYYEILEKVLGNKVQIYNGDTKNSEEALRKAESKEVLVTITTYKKATEGTNVVAWEVGFLVSSMNDEKNTEQACGRIRRTKEGVEKLDTALIYDYRHCDVYSLSSHGKTRDHRYKQLDFELDGQKKATTQRGIVFNRGY